MKRPSHYAINGGLLQDARPVPPRMRAQRSPDVPTGTFTASVVGDELVIRCSPDALVTPKEPASPGDAFQVELRDGALELSLEWRPAPSFDVGPTDPERTLVESTPEVMQDPRDTVPTSRAIVRLVPVASSKASERATPRPTSSRVHVEHAPSWRSVPPRERAAAGDDPDGPTRCQPLDDLEAELARGAPGAPAPSKASPASAASPRSKNSHVPAPASRPRTSVAAAAPAGQPDAAAKRRKQLRMTAYLAIALCAFSVIVRRHREEVASWKRQARSSAPSASAPIAPAQAAAAATIASKASVAPAVAAPTAAATALAPVGAALAAPGAAPAPVGAALAPPGAAPGEAAAAAAAVLARLTDPQPSVSDTPPQAPARGHNESPARGEPSRTKARRAVDALATASDAEALRLYQELANEPGANPAYRAIVKALRAKSTATP